MAQFVFAADDGLHGDELWTTDGTAEGTGLLADLNPGPGSSGPSIFGLSDGRVLLGADDGTHGDELWVSDGTAGGTGLLADINPGPIGSNPLSFLALGDGRVLFEADDGLHGANLWVTDGTAEGTHLVVDLPPGPWPVNYGEFFSLGDGRAVFQHIDGGSFAQPIRHAWVTDGTAEGSFQLADAQIAAGPRVPETPFSDLGHGLVMFAATDGVTGDEPWVTDGTREGTHLLADINPGPAGSTGPGLLAHPLGGDGGLALFWANDGVHGSEPWVTDGTAEGTHLLADINPGEASSGFNPQATTFADGLTLFWADDGTHGVEPWVTDGTAEGTRLLADVNPGPGSSIFSGTPFVRSDGQALFAADDGNHGAELWITDGTTDGTRLVADISPGPSTSFPGFSGGFFELADGRVLFSASDGIHGDELWVTDGTAEGTALLADLNPGPGSSYPGFQGPFTDVGDGRVLFVAQTAENGQEFWVTDGTAEGTHILTDINPGPASSYPHGLTPIAPAQAPVADASASDDASAHVAQNQAQPDPVLSSAWFMS